jgi:hypothetical protein
MNDIEDLPKRCPITGSCCKYEIGKSCMHPIHTYLDSRLLSKLSENKFETDKYDWPMKYSKNGINQIFNYLQEYEFFDDKNIYLSIYYFELMLQFSNIKITKKNIYPIYFLALMTAHKYLMDTPYSNETFSLLYKVDVAYLNICEIYFLGDIRINLNYKNQNEKKVKQIGETIKEFQRNTICNAVIFFEGFEKFIKKYHEFN